MTTEFMITDFEPPEGMGRGLVERDYSRHPVGYNSQPFLLPLIPEAEWAERLADQIAAKAQLSDIRNRGNKGKRIPSTHQGKSNYCWAHSTASAMMLQRAMQNEPYAELSAFAIACKIKNYRNQGGWGSVSLEYAAEHGIPDTTHWPARSWQKHHDDPTTWKNAAKHKVSEWMDLEPRNKAQLVTCLLLNIPVVSDFNWWRHSVCSMDLVSLRPFKTRIWNSWSDNWGEDGTGLLEGSKAIPDGMIAPFASTGG
jgi:hypothetical protein